jgi:hypothetical protein
MEKPQLKKLDTGGDFPHISCSWILRSEPHNHTHAHPLNKEKKKMRVICHARDKR